MNSRIGGHNMSNIWNLNNASALFSSMNSLSSGINFGDYNAIRNGSYRKLLKAYYADEKTTTSKKNTTTKKDDYTTDRTGLTLMKKDADELKDSAKALSDSSLWKQTNGSYDMDKITKAVKDFASDYNDVISQSAKVSNKDITQYKNWMSSMTSTMSKALSQVGVSAGVDGKLTVDEDTLKNADIKNLKSLFSGNTSYTSQIEQKASNISSAALRNSSLYSSNGMLSGTLASTFSGWM